MGPVLSYQEMCWERSQQNEPHNLPSMAPSVRSLSFPRMGHNFDHPPGSNTFPGSYLGLPRCRVTAAVGHSIAGSGGHCQTRTLAAFIRTSAHLLHAHWTGVIAKHSVLSYSTDLNGLSHHSPAPGIQRATLGTYKGLQSYTHSPE